MRRYGSKKPAKALQRAMVLDIVRMREKPLSEADKASLARSYGLALSEVERIVAEARRGRVG